ncbi:MAG TPA: S49 family peptidase [Bryobacteraceae bacterium]|nr:S49 family peptidase [Bryobacteraceae bacterium]
MNHLPHLATRIFDTPLLIAPQKLDVILSVLAPRLGLGAAPVTAAVTSERTPRKPYEITPHGIAIIPIEGTLVHKGYGLDALSGLRSYVEIQQEIEDAATDPAIRGILLDVDSPGGEVAGAFDLADTVFRARGAKPVYAAANNDAFSAAYLLASGAERLYASRTSGVGSIGVIVSHVDVSASDEKLGYKYTIIHAGARKADFHPHAPLSEEAYGVLAAEIERTYGLLVSTVARNRGVAETSIRETEAALYFGGDALAAGLADRIGTRQEALADLRGTVKARNTSIHLQGRTSMNEEQHAAEPSAVDIEAIRTEARRQGYAEAREVVELCALAGMPAKAAALLANQVAPAEARQSLLEARTAEEPPEIRSHVMPDTGTGASAKPEGSPVMKAVERLAGKGAN